ncbi:lactate dehydrogenase [Pedobacter sp. KR3-3]|uniref:Lactate dehydrogenase n=1 Tax=Pedobacter albus TaxID=3113905 RepID=A0ABU7I538_9SPHI|nr:lactate dehydrogenase [Pedobacter sp. KR3-3]MEE1944575.1 lactate dehydrogenase [Pedobacter sp. KR3-3]
MKAIAYHIKPQEKEWLILANHKKHDITIISNSLTLDTLAFAQGKEALIVFNEDALDAELVKGLKALGIKYIAAASFGIDHIDLSAVAHAGLKLANVPFENGGEMKTMYQVVKNLDNWAQGKCVGDACCCPNSCRIKPIDQH